MRWFCFLFILLHNIAPSLKGQDINFLMERVALMPDDTTKLNALNILSEQAPDPIWIAYNQQAYELAKKLAISPDKQIRKRAFLGVADAYNNFGFEMESKGEYPRAMEYWKKALKITVEYKDKQRTAVIYNNLGYVHYKMADFKNAIQHFNKSIKYKEASNDSAGMANTMVNVGSIYSALGDYKQALSYYGRALRIYEKKGIEDKFGIVFINMGNCNLRSKDYKNARTYFNAAREVYFKENNIFGISNCDLNLGIIQMDFDKNLDKALELFFNALKGFEVNSDSGKILLTKTYIAKALSQKDNPGEAYPYSKQAVNFFEKTNNCYDLTFASSVHQEICSKTGRKEEELKSKELFEMCSKKMKETPISELDFVIK